VRPFEDQKIVALVHLTILMYANHQPLRSTSKQSVPKHIVMLTMIELAPSLALLDVTTESHSVKEANELDIYYICLAY